MDPPPGGPQYGKKLLLIGVFFFLFGFISWINGTLIPYLRIACELEEWQAYLVTFAFYISYTVMAIPASGLLQRTGMVKGMSLGLVVMAAGCALFIPAAIMRFYPLFLLGLFVVGMGLTILQTAVNPYVTLLGPAESAARRMSMMGVCNKVAGILAPLVMGSIILNNSDGLIQELAGMNAAERAVRLDGLSRMVILPYCCLTGLLLLVAWGLRYAHLPDVQPPDTGSASGNNPSLSPQVRWQFALGFLAIFCCVGTEVLAGDTIGNYGLYHGLRLDVAKTLTAYPLAGMLIGYLLGIWAIPKYISQQTIFLYSSWLGLLFAVLAITLSGMASIVCIALLGLSNAVLWPAIWPQALKGVSGKLLNTGGAVLIMGIAGGALLPLLYGWLARSANNQWAYCILIPVYGFLVYYSWSGRRSRLTNH